MNFLGRLESSGSKRRKSWQQRNSEGLQDGQQDPADPDVFSHHLGPMPGKQEPSFDKGEGDVTQQ